MKFRNAPLLALVFFACSAVAQSSDTLRISIQDAEKQFLQKNLLLLAAQYNIDANKALIEQAKLWDNPVLVTDQNVYADHKWFAHGKNETTGEPEGQIFIQVQQLIKTAGKRGKLINLATTNSSMSELQFKDVLRNLKYQLRSDYYTVMQLSDNDKLYSQVLDQLTILLNGMQQQLQAGNISQKEFLRVQALVIGIQQDILDNIRQLNNVQTELRILLGDSTNAYIEPIRITNSPTNENVLLDTLLSQARENNPLYLLQKMQVVYQQQNLAYQKALRAPDLLVGPEYDHNSNYTPNYFGLGISLPLPLWNRNQGNIKSADISIKQQQVNFAQADLQLRNNVQNAYNKLLLTQKLSGQLQQDFYGKYEALLKHVLESYKQKQIDLVDFIDFFEAYKESRTKLLQQHLNLQLAKEELNFETGVDSIK